MRTRLAAFALVLANLIVGVAPCSGWTASAHARHDCCAEGLCPDQLSETGDLTQEAADSCCASSEDRQNADRSQDIAARAPASVAPPLSPFSSMVSGHPVAGARSFGAIPAVTGSVPRHLLLSVFLV